MTNKKRRQKEAKTLRKATGLQLPIAATLIGWFESGEFTWRYCNALEGREGTTKTQRLAAAVTRLVSVGTCLEGTCHFMRVIVTGPRGEWKRDI